jgi:hypothetical protein
LAPWITQAHPDFSAARNLGLLDNFSINSAFARLVRVTDKVLTRPLEKHHPHFLGAVVLQHAPRQTGQMQERTVIDGQQRLTTLQLLLDALHAELLSVQAVQPAIASRCTLQRVRRDYVNAMAVDVEDDEPDDDDDED